MDWQLLEWITQTIPWVEDRTPESNLQEAQASLDEFRQYATVTKPPKAEEKGNLETHFHTLQTKLRLSNRPAYVPSEGRLVSVSVVLFYLKIFLIFFALSVHSQDIISAWKNLEAGEKAKQDFLIGELQRLQRLEHLAAKFEHKVTNIETWAQGKDDSLSRNDDIESANLAEAMVSHFILIFYIR